MTDSVIMMELAKMQTKIRLNEHESKKKAQQLKDRDDEIIELRNKINSLELKDKKIAQNQSYLELKVLKDREQIKENQKLKEGNTNANKTKNETRRKSDK